MKGFAESDVDVQKPQGTEGSTEIGVVPEILKLYFMTREESREMVQGP